MDAHVEESLDHRLLHRAVFFTDAVFAIVMTLLVLELRPPEAGVAEQGRALVHMIGRFFAFTLSFAILGIFWIAHLSTTRRLARFDWPTAVANLVFLFPICLIPFVSAWLGTSVGGTTAWIAYSIVMIASSAANLVLVFVQTRDGGRLQAEPVTPRERIYRLARSSCAGLAFGAGLLGALAGRVEFAQYCWVLIPAFLLLFRLTLRPKLAPAASVP